jgi:hypothetical protein
MLTRHDSLAKRANRVMLGYSAHKHVMFGFRLSIHLANHVEFKLTIVGWRVNWIDPNPSHQFVLPPLCSVGEATHSHSHWSMGHRWVTTHAYLW